MKLEDEERIAANLSKVMAMICIRNSRLEELHAGLQLAQVGAGWMPRTKAAYAPAIRTQVGRRWA